MKKIISSPLTYLAVIVTLFNFACKKNATPDTNTTAASDCVKIQNLFTDAKNIMDEAGFKSGAYNGILNDTTIHVTVDSANHADKDTITINFGTVNHACFDGRSRRGKIIATYLTRYSDTTASHLISFINYYADDNLVSGTIYDRYKGYNSTGHLYFNDTANGSVTCNAGKTITWHATNVLAFTAGDSTAIWSDNVLAITGNSSGLSSDGVGYSTLISAAVIRNFADGCRKYLVQGNYQIAVSNASFRVSDLGSGGCDDMISVSIDGEIYQASSY